MEKLTPEQQGWALAFLAQVAQQVADARLWWHVALGGQVQVAEAQ